jgi:hypothetical protein
MQVLLIGIILTLLDVAISLYQSNQNPNAAEALATENGGTAWPM